MFEYFRLRNAELGWGAADYIYSHLQVVIAHCKCTASLDKITLVSTSASIILRAHGYG